MEDVASRRRWDAALGVLAGVTVTMVVLGFVIVAVAQPDKGEAASVTPTTEAATPAVPAVASTAESAPSFAEPVTPQLTPKAELQPVPAGEVNVSYAPDVPPRGERTDQRIVAVHFEVVENVVAIDPETGVEFDTWGYKVSGDDAVVTGTPGPMIRARVGDVLRFTLTNPATNTHPHNVDFHAVTGQGGGAADTTVAPGETAIIEGRLLYPGVFMYHCAYGDVPAHIAHGMYGGILVDPATPLPAVDHEFYIVQSEYYTTGTDPGVVDLDRAALTDEHPTMVVFNGAKGALTGDNALKIGVGERARIYFVNAGLDLDSNFHPIGSHWDAVWPEAALLSPPLRGSQTTLVPAGGGVVVDLVGQVPSRIILVDHALTRTFDKGAIGFIIVEGPANPEIFEAVDAAGAATPASQPSTGVPVSILAGSWTQQDLGATDEFADTENPADYSVNVLRVKAGTTVTWTNDDDQFHTVTAVDGSFDSGFMKPGDTWSYTFSTAGEFEYLCTPHPWMRAKVIVES